MWKLAPLSLAPLFVLAVVVIFRRQRARVQDALLTVARRLGGRVAEAGWIYYPRLVHPLEGAELQLSGMHGSRNNGSKTFAWVGCDGYPDMHLVVRRAPQRVGMLESLGRERPKTGERAFDEAFWLDTDDHDGALALLDIEVRRALMDFDPRLRVRLALGEATAYRDGRMVLGVQERRLDVSISRLPADVDELERLVKVVGLVHGRLLAMASARRSA